MEPTKQCTRCGRTLLISAFGKHRYCKDGLNPECKECNRERSKQWARTPAGIYSNIKGLQNHYKRKPVIITKEEFVGWYNEQTKQCVYCDILEEDIHLMHDYYRSESRLTIDCMDNDVGYVLGNIVLACGRCNSIKSDFFTHEEMLEIGRKYVAPKWLGKVKSDV